MTEIDMQDAELPVELWLNIMETYSDPVELSCYSKLAQTCSLLYNHFKKVPLIAQHLSCLQLTLRTIDWTNVMFIQTAEQRQSKVRSLFFKRKILAKRNNAVCDHISKRKSKQSDHHSIHCKNE